MAHAFDVCDEQAWARLGRLDDLDGLVCAAAVLDPIGPVGSYRPGDFRRTLEINVLGTLLAVHHCLPALRAGGGAVVTFSGGGATGPLPRFDAYAASKAAVVRLTENLAASLPPRRDASTASRPGSWPRGMHDATLAAGPEAAGEAYYERTRAGSSSTAGYRPSEAAELVCLLLDDGGAVQRAS